MQYVQYLRVLYSLFIELFQNPDAKPDYRTQSLTELNKLEQKVILLNEMLDNVDASRRERFAAGDVYDVHTSVHVLLHTP